MIFWTMAIKDIKRMTRDHKALLITLLMPAILSVILGFSVGRFIGGEIEITPAQVGIVRSGNFLSDQEQFIGLIDRNISSFEDSPVPISELRDNLERLDFEQMLLSEVFDLPDVQQFIHYQELTKQEALEKLDNGDLTSVIIFPENFNYRIWLGFITPMNQSIKIELLQNSNQQLKSSIVQSIVEVYTDQISAVFKGKDVLLQSSFESGVGLAVINQLDVFLEDVFSGGEALPALVSSGIEGRQQIGGLPYYAIGMGVMFMMFSAAFGASYTLKEKQQHTMDRMLISGRSLADIITGRFVATSVFVFFQLAILIVVTILLFGASWGHYGYLAIITLASSLTVGALAVLLSVINLSVASEKVTDLFQSVLIPLFSLLGGSFVSTAFMPEFMQTAGRMLINGAAMQGYLKVLQGYSPLEMPGVFIALGINATLFLVIAYILSKRMEGGR